jgi:hypothetical protein
MEVMSSPKRRRISTEVQKIVCSLFSLTDEPICARAWRTRVGSHSVEWPFVALENMHWIQLCTFNSEHVESACYPKWHSGDDKYLGRSCEHERMLTFMYSKLNCSEGLKEASGVYLYMSCRFILFLVEFYVSFTVYLATLSASETV